MSTTSIGSISDLLSSEATKDLQEELDKQIMESMTRQMSVPQNYVNTTASSSQSLNQASQKTAIEQWVLMMNYRIENQLRKQG